MTPKIFTCCYCSTRAALVLDKGRHELACASCGAPLNNMKTMPTAKSMAKKEKSRDISVGAVIPKRRKSDKYNDEDEHPFWRGNRKKRKKRKSWGRHALEKLWDDVVEDIFD